MKKVKFISLLIMIIMLFNIFCLNIEYASFIERNELSEEEQEQKDKSSKTQRDNEENENEKEIDENSKPQNTEITKPKNEKVEDNKSQDEQKEDEKKEIYKVQEKQKKNNDEENDNLINNEIKQDDTEKNQIDLVSKSYEKTIDDGIYFIKSALSSNLVLDIDNASMSSGTTVSLWNKLYQNNQKYKIQYVKDGYYIIESVYSGKYLSSKTITSKNGERIIQSDFIDSDSQKWYIKKTEDGYFNIISKASELYLDIPNGSKDLGTPVELYSGHSGINQKFRFEKISIPKGNKTIEDGIYNINTSLNFNMVLDVNNGSKNNNDNVELYTRHNGANQRFKIKYDGEGYYTIQAIHSGKVLTVNNFSTKEQANVMQYENLNLESQKWAIMATKEGYYYIISKCNGLYLDLQGGKIETGTNVEVFTENNQGWQKFRFYKAEVTSQKTIEPGNYMIISCLDKNKVIDIEGNVITNYANAEIWTNNNGNNQKFIITYEKDGFYKLKVFNSNKVLAVQNGSATNGANVVQEFENDSDAQKWAIVEMEKGTYSIISKSNNLALDIYMGNAINGANIEVYERHNGNNQKFKLVKTEFSKSIKEGKYAILATSDKNKVLDIEWGSTENGANLELWSSNGGMGQSFNIKYIGNGYYTVEVACSGKLLTVKGDNVIQQEDKDLDSQKWVIESADGKGNYSFRSKFNGYYLDINNNRMINGTNIEIYKGHDGDSQKFKLEELEYKGIDVSKYQKDINWNKVRTQIDFAIIRAGYRGSETGKIVEDQYYRKNIIEALSNGLNCGVYFFSQAINEQEGIEEAKWILERIKGYDIKYPIAIDTEWSSGDKTGRADWISNEDRTAAMKGFCKTIKDAGYTPIIYASKNWIKDRLNINELEEYDIWLAHYVIGAPDKKTDYTGKYSIWQYTNIGSIEGINGEVDINICYKKYF